MKNMGNQPNRDNSLKQDGMLLRLNEPYGGDVYFCFTCPDCGFRYGHSTAPNRVPNSKHDQFLKICTVPKRKYTRKSLFERIQSGYYGSDITKIIASHPTEEWEESEREKLHLYYCQKCKTISLRQPKTVWLTNDRLKLYPVPELCAKCRESMICPDTMPEEIKCPKCGSNNLQTELFLSKIID